MVGSNIKLEDKAKQNNDNSKVHVATIVEEETEEQKLKRQVEIRKRKEEFKKKREEELRKRAEALVQHKELRDMKVKEFKKSGEYVYELYSILVSFPVRSFFGCIF